VTAVARRNQPEWQPYLPLLGTDYTYLYEGYSAYLDELPEELVPVARLRLNNIAALNGDAPYYDAPTHTLVWIERGKDYRHGVIDAWALVLEPEPLWIEMMLKRTHDPEKLLADLLKVHYEREPKLMAAARVHGAQFIPRAPLETWMIDLPEGWTTFQDEHGQPPGFKRSDFPLSRVGASPTLIPETRRKSFEVSAGASAQRELDRLIALGAVREAGEQGFERWVDGEKLGAVVFQSPHGPLVGHRWGGIARDEEVQLREILRGIAQSMEPLPIEDFLMRPAPRSRSDRDGLPWEVARTPDTRK
jgi:hypothetical protein